jgi:hypothetical protein
VQKIYFMLKCFDGKRFELKSVKIEAEIWMFELDLLSVWKCK